MPNKIIMYLGGGVMSGVFGGGVLVALEEMNFYSHIEAIYAGSAGAFNAAYFLARQSKVGAQIYLEDLSRNFILPRNIPVGIGQRFWNRYIQTMPPLKIRNAINIDHVLEAVRHKKPLDVRAIRRQKIEFYVKLLDARTGEIVYLDARTHDIFALLKAAAATVPYYFPVQMIDNKAYMDGMIKEQLGLNFLLNKYPERKIAVIFNSSLRRGLRHYTKNLLEGLVAELHPYPIPLLKIFWEKEKLLRRDLALALREKRILFISPPKNNPILPSTTDSQRLKLALEMGKREAKKILQFVN